MDRVWEDLCTYYYQYKYTCYNLTWQKNLRKGLKIVTLLLSASGILSWTIWKKDGYLIVAYILSCIAQLISLIENNIILSDEGFEKLLDLQSKLKVHYDRLDKLYYECSLGHIKDEKKIAKLLFEEFKTYENEIRKLDSSLSSWEPEFLKRRVLPDYEQFLTLKNKKNESR
ncbi:hypothetical protein GCM10028805_57510 [Spirosoma harenae]